MQEERQKIHTLVFEGGGVKGLAFCGAVKYLEEQKQLSGVDCLIGSSAGAITAGMLAAGYTVSELESMMFKMNFKEFLDDTWGYFRDALRLIYKYGVCKGQCFELWFEDHLRAKLGVRDITFAQLLKKTGKTLVVTGSCVEDSKTYYFGPRETPDMRVALAVRISMSIPFVYTPVRLADFPAPRHGSGAMPTFKTFVDGGMLENYPISYADKDPTSAESGLQGVIGLKLMSTSELHGAKQPVATIFEYLSSVLNGIYNNMEKIYMKPKYWKHTVKIDTFDISTLDFDLSLKQKKKLLESGYSSIAKHLLSL